MGISRDSQSSLVERQFNELADFARHSWSNIDIVNKVQALQREVRKLYRPAPSTSSPSNSPAVSTSPARAKPRPKPVTPMEAPQKKPWPPVRRPPHPRPSCEGLEPIHVDANTRWG